MTNPAPKSSNPALRVVVARKYGKADENGHKKSTTTRIGRAYRHTNGQGINILLDSTPVLTGNARILIFAGEKGAKFDGGAQQLSAFDVVEYQAGGETKKQWNRIGTAFLSVNGGAYDVVLDALPSSGKVTCIVPKPRAEGTDQAEDMEQAGDEEAPF